MSQTKVAIYEVTKKLIPMGAREKSFSGGRAKIPLKILLHKNMLMIWSNHDCHLFLRTS